MSRGMNGKRKKKRGLLVFFIGVLGVGLETKGIGLAFGNVESGSPAVSIDANADADADARRK